MGNDEFLRGVFGDDLADGLPLVVSFIGDPRKVPSKVWFGTPWDGSGNAPLPAAANNYFSLATFRVNEAGSYRRKRACFHALYAVMLDDVGTKVAMERLSLSPSWLLETSDGNHQAGYLLREPLTDGRTADGLMNAIVGARLCDPSTSGPRARLARLPVAVNGKHEPPVRCQLVKWSPDLRYSVEEIGSGLQLDVIQLRPPRQRNGAVAHGHPADGDPVLIPDPAENAVLEALRRQNLYRKPLGEGKHEITCPWITDHIGEVDDSTAYLEPDDHWPIGGFKCLHGHCADKRIGDLLGKLYVERSAARMKPTIYVSPGELHRVADAAERELARSGRHYQRGGLIVTIVTDPGTHETWVQEVTQPALLGALAAVTDWERYDGRSHDWVRIDPPQRPAAVLFASSSYEHLPVLNGLARQLYLRRDGSLMTAPGYDGATGMFGVFDSREFSVPDNPTQGEAESALVILGELLTEFKFTNETDRAAALSAMLTAAIRPSLSHAPMFHVRAHMVGSGKSYLCRLITAFATPQGSTPTTFPRDDEECRKLLLAELLRAPAAIEFDNLTSDLIAHKSLCTALTSEHLSGRILGVSKTASVSTRTLFLSSGNNVGPMQDMTRRCVTIHLDPGCEVPAARTFERPELIQEVVRERGRFVSAALTIVRAWIVAGRPKSACKAVSGYHDWSDLCRQPLLWLGCADPTDSVFEAMAEDPDRETLGRLLAAWQSAFGKAGAMVRDAVRRASEHAELREILFDIAEERGVLNRWKLGWWLKQHTGQIADGLRLMRVSGNRSAGAWRVESVLTVSEVFATPVAEGVSALDHALPDVVDSKDGNLHDSLAHPFGAEQRSSDERYQGGAAK